MRVELFQGFTFLESGQHGSRLRGGRAHADGIGLVGQAPDDRELPVRSRRIWR